MTSSIAAARRTGVARSHAPRHEDHQYRTFFEHNPRPMILFDRDTLQIIAVSDGAIASYGYSREEFQALRTTDLRPREDRQLDSADPRSSRHQRKDGTIFDVEVEREDLVLGGRECRVAICEDVTQRRQGRGEPHRARRQAAATTSARTRLLTAVRRQMRTPTNGVPG